MEELEVGREWQKLAEGERMEGVEGGREMGKGAGGGMDGGGGGR